MEKYVTFIGCGPCMERKVSDSESRKGMGFSDTASVPFNSIQFMTNYLRPQQGEESVEK